MCMYTCIVMPLIAWGKTGCTCAHNCFIMPGVCMCIHIDCLILPEACVCTHHDYLIMPGACMCTHIDCFMMPGACQCTHIDCLIMPGALHVHLHCLGHACIYSWARVHSMYVCASTFQDICDQPPSPLQYMYMRLPVTRPTAITSH